MPENLAEHLAFVARVKAEMADPSKYTGSSNWKTDCEVMVLQASAYFPDIYDFLKGTEREIYAKFIRFRHTNELMDSLGEEAKIFAIHVLCGDALKFAAMAAAFTEEEKQTITLISRIANIGKE